MFKVILIGAARLAVAYLAPPFRQFDGLQLFTSFARWPPLGEQVFRGHLTEAALTVLPWALASSALNKNGNSPVAAMAMIFNISPPNGFVKQRI